MNIQELENIDYAGMHGIIGMDDMQMSWYDERLSMDEQPPLVTVPNNGIPSYLTNLIDPRVIKVLTAPTRAQLICGGEVKKGTWTDLTTTFEMEESTGYVSAYGDYNTNGRAGSETNYLVRDSFYYQVIIEWGERAIAFAKRGNIDAVQRKNIAAAKTLNLFRNKTYFYGVSGKRLYGLLNDPNLAPALTPLPKAAGGVSWDVATQCEIVKDIDAMFEAIVRRTKGYVDKYEEMTLALSGVKQIQLDSTCGNNCVVTSASELLKKTYPRLEIISAPEYSSDAGEGVQLIIKRPDGNLTAEAAFNEKERQHQIVADLSSWKQKKSAGTWGAIIVQPMFVQNMVGV